MIPQRLFHRSLLALTATVCQAVAQGVPVPDGLQLWLRADAGIASNLGEPVVLWQDQSGQGHDAFQIDPASAPVRVGDAVAGLPVLRFDGNDDYLDVAPTQGLVMEGNLSSWFVVRMDDFATFRSVWAKTSSNLPAPTDYYTLPGSGIPRMFRGDGTFNNLTSLDGIRPLRAGEFMIVGFDVADGVATHYLNGQPNGSGSVTTSVADLFTGLKIGTRDDFVTRLKGDLAELMIYDRALSEGERGAIIGYLKARYGLENDPPEVSIASPTSGQTIVSPGSLTVQATASDADGRVVSVQMFANGQRVGQAIAPPFSFPILFRTPGTVVLTAVAEDDAGLTTESEPVTITVTGESDPQLQVRDNLQLWLRSDLGVTRGAGDAVTVWEDQSGNANHALAADPDQAPQWVEDTDLGQPALRFDGSNDYLEVATSPGLENTGDIASFFVVRFDDLATFRAVWGKTGGNLPRSTDYYLLPGSGLPRLYRGSPDGIAEVTGASGVPAGQYVLAGFQMEGNQVTHWLNGQANGTGTLNAPLEDAGTPLRIGTRDDFGTRFKGDMAELLIFDAALSGDDQNAVLGYLAARYKLPLVQLANAAPEVRISVPAPGEVIAPTTIPIQVSATDTDGAIVEVSYFANGQLLGRSTMPPFRQGVRVETGGTLVLTATARDNLGAVTTSEPVVLTAIGGVAGDLSVRDGLQLWLRADLGQGGNAGQSVTGWADQSGKGNDAFQFSPSNAPVLAADGIGGHPSVRFDGVDQFLTVNTAPGLELVGDITSMALLRFDDFATFRAVWAKTAGNQPRPIDYYLAAGSGVPTVLRGGSEGNAAVSAAGGIPAGSPVLLGFTIDDGFLTHYRDGRPFGSGSVDVVAEDFFMPITLGTRDDFGTRFRGDLSELLIYDRALTESELQAVSLYLAGRYGILVFAPVTLEDAEVPDLSASWADGSLLVRWTGPEGAYQLLQNTTLQTGGWTLTTVEPVHEDGVNRVILPATGDALFLVLQAR